MKIGIIGHGRIGSELSKRGLERGWEIVIATPSGICLKTSAEERLIDELSNWMEYFQKVDIACLCIPTLDDGKIAYEYIRALVERGIPVATCEKGALGNYFPELKFWIDKIGHSGTVGGGTRLLHWLKDRLTVETKEIHLIVNGTLNYVFDELSKGKPLEEVVEEAKKLGYAEPGAQEALEMINTEACRDVPMKVSVLLNSCGFGEIRAREINTQAISEVDLKKLIQEATFRRYIVSITKKESEEDVVGGFKLKINEWQVSSGFKNRAQNPLFLQLVPPGVNNAALICGLEGTYILTGPGAGATPTVTGSLIKDIEDLLRIIAPAAKSKLNRGWQSRSSR